MDLKNIKKAEIKKYIEDNKDMREAEFIATIFGVFESYIQSLLDFGFVYNYEKGWMVTKVYINDSTHLVWIQNQIKEDLGLRRFRISTQKHEGIELIGSDDYYLYTDLKRNFVELNVNGIFNYISNIYRLNHIEKEEKETFKQFVESEKGSESNKEI